MMYIHYCKYCRRIHILNGHKLYCPACSGKLSELDISYMKYVNLSREERRALREKCADEKSLRELSVDYPRRGGAKWFQAAESARTGRTTDNKSASRREYSPHLRVSVSRSAFEKQAAEKKNEYIAEGFHHHGRSERTGPSVRRYSVR